MAEDGVIPKKEKDICVCGCGKETPYDKDTPVYMRAWYVDGAGQLRKECWERIYKVVPD